MATSSFDTNIVLTPEAADIVNRVLEEKKNYFPDAKPRTDEDDRKAAEAIKKWIENGCRIG